MARDRTLGGVSEVPMWTFKRERRDVAGFTQNQFPPVSDA
jgi:hypothetical protein